MGQKATWMQTAMPDRKKKPEMKERPAVRRKDQRAARSAFIVSSIMCAAASYPIRDQADMMMPDKKAV